MAEKTVFNPAGLEPHERPAFRKMLREIAEAWRPDDAPDGTHDDDPEEARVGDEEVTLRSYEGDEVPLSEARPDPKRCQHLTQRGNRCPRPAHGRFCTMHDTPFSDD